MALRLATLKRRASATGIPTIYITMSMRLVFRKLEYGGRGR
jgi:hypothetical protein